MYLQLVYLHDKLCATSRQNLQSCHAIFSLQCGGVKLSCEVGKERSRPKPYPKRFWGPKFSFPLQFCKHQSRVSPWGDDYKHAAHLKRTQDFFPEREPWCCCKWNCQHGCLLTSHMSPAVSVSRFAPHAGAKADTVCRCWIPHPQCLVSKLPPAGVGRLIIHQ